MKESTKKRLAEGKALIDGFREVFTSRGFEVPHWDYVDKGWWPLLGELLDGLNALGVKPEIAQVKEKFGGLRFYVDYAAEPAMDLIDAAEHKSYLTCETCGEPGKPRSGGWVKTMCDKHAEERGRLKVQTLE